VQGGLDIQIWQKFHEFTEFRISIGGGAWSFVWGGWAHQSPPWRRDRASVLLYKNVFSRTKQHPWLWWS